MAKISYSTLQKKYAGKFVALTQGEGKVIASSKDMEVLLKKVKEHGYNKKDCVFVGPVEEHGTASV